MSTPWGFPLPNYADSPADFMLAYDVHVDIATFAEKFLAKDPDPQYANPEAYLESLADVAFGIKNNPYTAKYAPAGWSPIKASFSIYKQAVAYLRTVPVNPGDPNTNNVYDAWVAKTGYLYGGHPLIPTAPSVDVTGDGVNTITGPGSVPGGTIFGGSK